MPEVVPGTAIVKVLAATALSYVRDVFQAGEGSFRHAFPQAIGMFAVGRIVALGPDATSLKLGDLVFQDPTVHARDNPEVWILQGYGNSFDTEDLTLGAGEWRHGSFAEYVRVPLESIVKLNEARLIGQPADDGLGYSIPDLVHLNPLLIAYGGLNDVNVTAGDTVVVAPASGGTGWAAVLVALSMGAKVIALGRNIEKLRSMAARVQGVGGRLLTLPISGDAETDTKTIKAAAGGSVDVYFDASPANSATSSHIKGSMMSLRHGGRISLMGVLFGDVPVPLYYLTLKNITMKGTVMYTRDQRQQLVKMVETGILKLGSSGGLEMPVIYDLDDWDVAFDEAKKLSGIRPIAFCPK